MMLLFVLEGGFHESPVVKNTPEIDVGFSLISNNSMKHQKPQVQVNSVGSQTCLTTIASCQHAVYEWEFQEEEAWISMDACTSAAIEVSLRSQWNGPDSAVRRDIVLMHGSYEFNLSRMEQKNIQEMLRKMLSLECNSSATVIWPE